MDHGISKIMMEIVTRGKDGSGYISLFIFTIVKTEKYAYATKAEQWSFLNRFFFLSLSFKRLKVT